MRLPLDPAAWKVRLSSITARQNGSSSRQSRWSRAQRTDSFAARASPNMWPVGPVDGSEDQFTILEYAIIIWKSSTTTIFFNGIARKLVGVKPNTFLAHYRGSLVVVQRAESNILVEEHAATAGFSAAARAPDAAEFPATPTSA